MWIAQVDCASVSTGILYATCHTLLKLGFAWSHGWEKRKGRMLFEHGAWCHKVSQGQRLAPFIQGVVAVRPPAVAVTSL